MTLIDLGGGGAEPVSLDEAKAFCRIERGDEDALLAALLAAARETAERETRLVLRRRTFRLVLDMAPEGRRLAVARGPVVSVQSITAYDGAGVPRAFAGTDAILRPDGTILLSEGVAGAAVNGIELELTIGLLPAAVPEGLKLAMKQIVAAAYELRAAVDPALQPALVPPAARALLQAARPVRL